MAAIARPRRSSQSPATSHRAPSTGERRAEALEELLAPLRLLALVAVGHPLDVHVVQQVKVAEPARGLLLDPGRAVAVVVAAVDHRADEVGVEDDERRARGLGPRDRLVLARLLAAADRVDVGVASSAAPCRST